MAVGSVGSASADAGSAFEKGVNQSRAKEDAAKRGQRDSPRSPAVAAKIAKLEGISKKLSLKQTMPVMPFGTQGSEADGRVEGGRHADQPVTTPTNADIMARLGTMMGSMVVKDNLIALKRDVMQETKVAISESVDPVKNEIADIRKDVAKMGLRVADVEKVFANGVKGDDSDFGWKAKINDIEKTLTTMKQIDNPVAVIGGLEGAGTLEQADKWLASQLALMGVAKTVTVFIKGDEFKGIIFVRFLDADAMNAAMAVF